MSKSVLKRTKSFLKIEHFQKFSKVTKHIKKSSNKCSQNVKKVKICTKISGVVRSGVTRGGLPGVTPLKEWYINCMKFKTAFNALNGVSICAT